MSEATSLLFALPGFRVLEVSLDPDGRRRVLVESVSAEGGCPACGVASSVIKDRPVRRVKDLPHGDTALRMSVRKRRFLCPEPLCRRGSFTEVTEQLPAPARLTARLRAKVAAAICTTNRAVSDVAAEYDVAWATALRILIAAAADLLQPPVTTTRIGIDETRTRRVRWLFGEAGWRRSDPWMTSIVDLDPTTRGGIIGLAAGRSGACVEGWLSWQSNEFRAAVQVVAIDPSAPYAAGIARALSHARIVLDHFHLVLLANQMLTEVRQRVARERYGHRGRRTDPAWAHRRLLLRAGDTLGPTSLARMVTIFRDDDPTDEIGAAWGVKELLRQLLAAHGPTRYSRSETSHRLTRFLTARVNADMPETIRLATTVERRWPAIEGFLQLGVTNAATEGHNRVIKQTKRVACGFRNQANYERRIMMHNAARRAA
jgi:transposase